MFISMFTPNTAFWTGPFVLDPLLKRAAEYGMESVAITDHGTMFGVVEFYEKARKAGIKPDYRV